MEEGGANKYLEKKFNHKNGWWWLINIFKIELNGVDVILFFLGA